MLCQVEAMSLASKGKIEFQFRDLSGGLWYAELFEKKFPFLRAGDLVYVRNASCTYLSDREQPEL